MGRRRRRPAVPPGAHRDQDTRGVERATRSRPGKRGPGARPPKTRPSSHFHEHEAQLETGIGETDGLAEVDDVVFVGQRLGEPEAPAPEVDPHRELEVVSRLMHREVPSLELEWMPGEWIDMKTLADRPIVVYCHPGTDDASVVLEDGEDELVGWDAAECRAFADHDVDFSSASHRVIGVSSQSATDQLALATQEALPHVVLSDGSLEFAEEMGLPTFEVDGMRLYERLTFVARGGRVRKVFYPVPDPATHAAEVAEWLQEGEY